MGETGIDFEQERCALRIKVFSSVAHDVKTPLACIIGALQTLEQMHQKLSQKQREMLLNTALMQAQELDRLFTAMLENATPQ